MDDFSLEGEILRDALDKIAQINQLLGGNGLTLQGVALLVSKTQQNNSIKIVDVGCGNGDMLRKLADYGKKNNLNLDLLGIDANHYTINHARHLSEKYANIQYSCEDIFDQNFKDLKYDIVLCTLTLHHFKDNEIIDLMTIFHENARLGIVVNDLQRSIIAYRLFQGLCVVFKLNKMSKEDGLTSILRGFKKPELISYCKKLGIRHYILNWKWAFRYQWIIFKD
jgi:2-polyprenyl-3-methyl-5-hydroxy-6-metoxy-1,4-benzoquinol methylase